MLAADFEYIAQLVRQEAGITLDAGKEYLVEARVDPLAKSLGHADITSFVCELRRSLDVTLKRQLIEALTTHETSFFRDQEPFEALREKVLPDLISRQAVTRTLSIWCGAASTGQEPYSLCMLLREHFPELSTWAVSFRATDLSTAILERARSGSYNQIEVNRGLPVRLLAKYFQKEGNCWVIVPAIRDMVQFTECNLLHPPPQAPAADLVMLRNVLIYFDVETKRRILRYVRQILKPHGYLFLGTAETTLNLDENFRCVSFGRTSCYQKLQ